MTAKAYESYADREERVTLNALSTDMSLWDGAEIEVCDEPDPGKWWTGTATTEYGGGVYEADAEGYYESGPVVDKIERVTLGMVDVTD